MLKKDYDSKQESYFSHERKEMLKYIPNTVECVLDVGCSNGAFGDSVKKKFGCEVWGIEPDFKSFQKAGLVLDRVFNTFFDHSLDLQEKKFDCIVFNDVLEHLPDPFEAIAVCRKHLSQSGVVVASIPNIRFLDAIHHIIIQKDFHYVGAGIFDKTHLRFFTKKSIERMFLQAGYDLKQIEGINSIKEINAKGYRNFTLLNTLLFNSISDMEYQQFAVVAG